MRAKKRSEEFKEPYKISLFRTLMSRKSYPDVWSNVSITDTEQIINKVQSLMEEADQYKETVFMNQWFDGRECTLISGANTTWTCGIKVSEALYNRMDQASQATIRNILSDNPITIKKKANPGDRCIKLGYNTKRGGTVFGWEFSTSEVNRLCTNGPKREVEDITSVTSLDFNQMSGSVH